MIFGKTAKIIALIFALLAFAGSYYLTYSKGYSAGKTACAAAVSSAAIHGLDDAQKGAADAQRHLQEETDRIISLPDTDDGPIAPVLAEQLKRMHAAAGKAGR